MNTRTPLRGQAARRANSQAREFIAGVVAHLEGVADGTRRGHFGMTPERARDELARGIPLDPEPAGWPEYDPEPEPGPGSDLARQVICGAVRSRVPLHVALVLLRVRLAHLGALVASLITPPHPAAAVPVGRDLSRSADPHTGPPTRAVAPEVAVILSP